jgi:hypothetical protein
MDNELGRKRILSVWELETSTVGNLAVFPLRGAGQSGAEALDFAATQDVKLNVELNAWLGRVWQARGAWVFKVI